MYILAQQLADPAPDPDSAPEKKWKANMQRPLLAKWPSITRPLYNCYHLTNLPFGQINTERITRKAALERRKKGAQKSGQLLAPFAMSRYSSQWQSHHWPTYPKPASSRGRATPNMGQLRELVHAPDAILIANHQWKRTGLKLRGKSNFSSAMGLYIHMYLHNQEPIKKAESNSSKQQPRWDPGF